MVIKSHNWFNSLGESDHNDRGNKVIGQSGDKYHGSVNRISGSNTDQNSPDKVKRLFKQIHIR